MNSKEFFSLIKEDFKRNRNNTKGLVVVSFFRAASFLASRRRNVLFWFLGLPVIAFYKIFVEWILSVELQVKTSVGPGLIIYHGQGLVVNDQTRIGKNVTLRHNTTIGNRQSISGESSCPIIEDNVDIGANCVVIGGISIGENSVIGAGAVVTKDVPKNVIVAGNPAKIIRMTD